MVTTTWIAGSGDWNDASNWSDGVPTDADVAVFAGSTEGTIAGDGPAAAITMGSEADVFSGTHDVGTVTIGSSDLLTLASTAALSFQALDSTGGTLQLDDGATLGTGQITLDDAVLTGATSDLDTGFGLLTNPIALTGIDDIGGVGTLSGAITGAGSLVIRTLSATEPTFSDVTLAGAAAAYTGLIYLDSGTVRLPGDHPATDTIIANGDATVDSATHNLEVFDASSSLELNQTSGHATVIGAVGGTAQPPIIELNFLAFGHLSISGGTGSVTVFGGDESGSIFGGSGGDNVIVAGASAFGSIASFPVSPVTIGGGGAGDLLVVTGRLNNVIAAAGGNETLTGGTATGNNTFFAGSGADAVVAGAGQDTVVAGSGAATVFGGSGAAAIFAEAGSVLAVGGIGSDYIQVGRGASTLFTGAGADLIGVVNGQSGGSLTVVGFRAGVDHVQTQGFGAFTASSAGGNTTLLFPDQTRVTLVGVGSLPASVFG